MVPDVFRRFFVAYVFARGFQVKGLKSSAGRELIAIGTGLQLFYRHATHLNFAFCPIDIPLTVFIS